MCRSTIDGGRRCPSHTDPVLIANRNARRREKYAKSPKKGVPHIPATVEHGATSLTSEHPLYSKFKAPKGKTLYEAAGEEEVNSLGITTANYRGYLVESGYIDAIQVSGQINYNKLNETSYKEFGFQEPSEIRRGGLTLNELKELSGAELEAVSHGEQSALTLYTTSAYNWINGALYAKSPNLRTPGEYEQPNKIYFPEEGYGPYSEPTPDCLKQTVEKMDSGLLKNAGDQKTVYRGMKFWHEAFESDLPEDETVAAYVDKHYSLGQEVVFDGYQSASYSPAMGGSYAGENGLIFEIKTSSGVNVSKVSNYDLEREIILPRNSRYMIVGIHKKVDYEHTDVDKNIVNPTRYNSTVVQMIEITEDGYAKTGSNKATPPPLTEKQLATKDY
jgi:hypothetical protein